MIAPERWYEYQKNYQKYGLDMKPKPDTRIRSRRKRSSKKITLPIGSGKKVAFSMVLAVGIAMIVLIIITAYTANPVSYTHLDVYKRQILYRRHSKNS